MKTGLHAIQIVPPLGEILVEVALAFGRVLRKLRTAAGLTQEQLAFEAELHRNYVSMMERGVNQPTITTLIKLSKPLGSSAAEIVTQVERLIQSTDSDQ